MKWLAGMARYCVKNLIPKCCQELQTASAERDLSVGGREETRPRKIPDIERRRRSNRSKEPHPRRSQGYSSCRPIYFRRYYHPFLRPRAFTGRSDALFARG